MGSEEIHFQDPVGARNPCYGPGSDTTPHRSKILPTGGDTFLVSGLSSTWTAHAKELPEDEELNDYVDAEIPGLSPSTEHRSTKVDIVVWDSFQLLSQLAPAPRPLHLVKYDL